MDCFSPMVVLAADFDNCRSLEFQLIVAAQQSIQTNVHAPATLPFLQDSAIIASNRLGFDPV